MLLKRRIEIKTRHLLLVCLGLAIALSGCGPTQERVHPTPLPVAPIPTTYTAPQPAYQAPPSYQAPAPPPQSSNSSQPSNNACPPGVTAICGDGSTSDSQSRRGTCSHHGGVARWCN